MLSWLELALPLDGESYASKRLNGTKSPVAKCDGRWYEMKTRAHSRGELHPELLEIASAVRQCHLCTRRDYVSKTMSVCWSAPHSAAHVGHDVVNTGEMRGSDVDFVRILKSCSRGARLALQLFHVMAAILSIVQGSSVISRRVLDDRSKMALLLRGR